MSGGVEGIFILIVLVMAVALYFIPTIIAANRRKANTTAIFALNLFLGWCLIGWVISLVWALSVDDPDRR
ncbi:MAG: superinfection immunity protein [Candidatus Dormibacteraceae bacterium]